MSGWKSKKMMSDDRFFANSVSKLTFRRGKMKDFIVKENDAFRLRIKGWKCAAPNDLNSIEFVQEILKDGEVQMTSTYNYFLTDEEIELLAKGLLTFNEEGSIVNV